MKIRMVIADDHRVMLDGIRAMLKDVDDVEIIGDALNGEELVNTVRALHPDVVLTDIQMPVMDGIQATKNILEKQPSVKIIALTMLSESISIRRMLEAGVAGYVLKTADKEELVRVIRKVAAGGKDFSAEIASQLANGLGAGAGTNPIDILTRREKEILRYIAQGLTDKEIAEKVFLSSLTVITHRKNILSKLGLKNKVEITRFAMENGLE